MSALFAVQCGHPRCFEYIAVRTARPVLDPRCAAHAAQPFAAWLCQSCGRRLPQSGSARCERCEGWQTTNGNRPFVIRRRP